MSLYQKVKAVERLFARLARESQEFQVQTSLSCLPGCGKCCAYPNVQATPLEFLPLAYQWFLSGEAEGRLAQFTDEDSICTNFLPFGPLGQGSCGTYAKRGLICRLFGYSASNDKHGIPHLSACKPIKEQTPEQIITVANFVANGGKIPLATNYYRVLASIDPILGGEPMPINKAIKEAILTVLTYYSYRSHPHRPSNAA
ncbi:MAG: YkgJ family cysteine cluster protein [Bacteroidia bacterium]|nr:YkgJ family cysteine cluster protein [Bacteroidia bacterium]